MWTGPFKVTAKISDLNYESLGQNDRKWVVHINRLKAVHGHVARESKTRTPNKSRQRKNSAISHSSAELIEVQLGVRPLLKEVPQEHDTVPNPPYSLHTRPPPPTTRYTRLHPRYMTLLISRKILQVRVGRYSPREMSLL